MPWKDKQCFIPIDEVITGKPLSGVCEKISTFLKQKAL